MLKLGEFPAIKSDALCSYGSIIDAISRSDYPFGRPASTSLIV
jgi:hypothetical protein